MLTFREQLEILDTVIFRFRATIYILRLLDDCESIPAFDDVVEHCITELALELEQHRKQTNYLVKELCMHLNPAWADIYKLKE